MVKTAFLKIDICNEKITCTCFDDVATPFLQPQSLTSLLFKPRALYYPERSRDTSKMIGSGAAGLVSPVLLYKGALLCAVYPVFGVAWISRVINPVTNISASAVSTEVQGGLNMFIFDFFRFRSYLLLGHLSNNS